MVLEMWLGAQAALTAVLAVCVFRKAKRPAGGTFSRSYRMESERLAAMRRVRLTEPATELSRPKLLNELVGQEEAVRALRAVICCANPQHVILYGPPGVGKTCAARLVLEEARRAARAPFRPDAPFVELDAACLRYDERSIADPLMGSVHDPIYQGAGPLGLSGIPQPKEGAVTRAHGGVLFLDEIGQMPGTQLSKLLKVLEDRTVRFDSAYYRSDDPNTPAYIHEVFRHGMPADFRLIGATTKSPEELPEALRSRCAEIRFKSLSFESLTKIAQGAAERMRFPLSETDAFYAARASGNGREVVNLVQTAVNLARLDNRERVERCDLEFAAHNTRICGKAGELRAKGEG